MNSELSYAVWKTQAGWNWEVRRDKQPILHGITESATSARATALLACLNIREAEAEQLPRIGLG